MHRWAKVVGLLAVALSAAVGWADTVTLKSGRLVRGTVIEQTPEFARVRQQSGGIEVVSKHRMSDVASIEGAAERKGVAYARIPVGGEFGVSVTADGLRKAVEAARADGAKVVLLCIDSPGGSVGEMERVLEVIRENGDLRFVAVVKQAISAAAVTAVACKEIVMLPGANIGGAVVFKVGPDGTPELVEEKFASIVRSVMRQAAEIGGHDPLWVRGMTEAEVGIYLTAGKVSEKAVDGTSVLVKPAGRILTMTGEEARAWGLAKGGAETVSGVREVLGIGEWYEASDRPWKVAMEAAAKSTLVKDRGAYAASVRPEVERLKEGLAAAQVKLDGALAQGDRHLARLKVDAEAVRKWAEGELRKAERSPNGEKAAASVRAEYKRRLEGLEQQYTPDVKKCEVAAREAKGEVDRLEARLREIVAEAPAKRR